MGAEQVDRCVGEVGEVGEGAFLDAALVVPEGGAQELGVVDAAVLDGLDDGDVHGRDRQCLQDVKRKSLSVASNCNGINILQIAEQEKQVRTSD